MGAYGLQTLSSSIKNRRILKNGFGGPYTQNLKFMPVNREEAKAYIKKPTIHDTEVKRVENNRSEDPLRSTKPSPFMDSILEDKDGKDDVPFGRKITFSKMMKTNKTIDNHNKA